MSTTPPPKPTTNPLFDFVEEAVDDLEFEQIQQLSPEQLDAELKEKGIDLERAKAKIERARTEAFAAVAGGARSAAGAGPANVIAIGSAKRSGGSRTVRVLFPVLAAAAAVAVAVWQRDEIVAFFKPGPVPTQTAPNPLPTPPGPPPEQVEANALRKEAYEDCKKGYFHFCEDELDQAAALDPAGNKTLEVIEARKAIARAAMGVGDAGLPLAKPGVEPWETPYREPRH